MSTKESDLLEYQKALGERIRRMRRDRLLTQLDLARQVGVTNGQISTIERGLSAPSIGTLRRIADALGVPVVAFFDAPERSEVSVVRTGERRRMTNPKGPEVMEVLAGSRALSAIQVEIEPEGACKRVGDSDDTEFFLFVLQGQLEMICNEKTFLLRTGDSARADGRQVRHFRNVGESRAVLLEVVSSCPIT